MAGRLCLWSHEEKGRNNFKASDRRLDESYPTFEKFRNSLKLRCENGSEPSIVEMTPNSSWPDVVYYHSYTQPGMGWRIHVLDSAVSVGVSAVGTDNGSGGADNGSMSSKSSSSIWPLLSFVVATLITARCCWR